MLPNAGTVVLNRKIQPELTFGWAVFRGKLPHRHRPRESFPGTGPPVEVATGITPGNGTTFGTAGWSHSRAMDSLSLFERVFFREKLMIFGRSNHSTPKKVISLTLLFSAQRISSHSLLLTFPGRRMRPDSLLLTFPPQGIRTDSLIPSFLKQPITTEREPFAVSFRQHKAAEVDCARSYRGQATGSSQRRTRAIEFRRREKAGRR